MGQDEASKVSVDHVLSLIDQLTPAQWEQLRKRLLDRAWKQHFQQFANSDFTRNASQTWKWMIDRLDAGRVDEDFKQASAKAWQDLMDRLGTMSNWNEDPEMQLETVFQELQAKGASANNDRMSGGVGANSIVPFPMEFVA